VSFQLEAGEGWRSWARTGGEKEHAPAAAWRDGGARRAGARDLRVTTRGRATPGLRRVAVDVAGERGRCVAALGARAISSSRGAGTGSTGARRRPARAATELTRWDSTPWAARRGGGAVQPARQRSGGRARVSGAEAVLVDEPTAGSRRARPATCARWCAQAEERGAAAIVGHPRAPPTRRSRRARWMLTAARIGVSRRRRGRQERAGGLRP